jgi:transcription antitermination factor NusG
MPDWLVATAEHGKQAFARNHLKAGGFDCYFPLFRERRIVRGTKRFVVSYLFGRYFFVLFCPTWRGVMTTLGVDELFMHDEAPALVREAVIDEIRSRENPDGVITLRRGFRAGQRVTPKSGPLKGLIGTFHGLTSSEREVAFFSMLGQMTRVEFASGCLALAQ